MMNIRISKSFLMILLIAVCFLTSCQSGNVQRPDHTAVIDPVETAALTEDTLPSPAETETPAVTDDPEPHTVSYDLFSGYCLVLAETATQTLKDKAADFAAKWEKLTSVKLTIKSDWEGGPVKRTETEFVLGDTTRRDEFSPDADLGDGMFQMARRGSKIFFVGKDEEASIQALKYLITCYLLPQNSNQSALCTDSLIFGLQEGDTVTCDFLSRFRITKEELDAYIAVHDTLNAVECHADPTGVVDGTELLQYLHNSGKKVYYPNGNYLFNGETLCFSGGVEFESQDGVVIHNDISENPIVNFDAFGNLIGLQQNHLERKTGLLDSKNGSLVPPPLSKASFETTVDFMPIFYNDFGLTRSLTGQYGWMGWFYWSWNHQDNKETLDSPGYDPQRHPLLGWYYGDDPVVLDWICYWLRQYGINQMILLSTPNRDTWENPYDAGYWHYQLFNHVKNFEAMSYVLEVTYGGDRDEALNHWKEVIRYYRDYPHYYTRVVDGKKLAVVYNWQENVLCGKVGGQNAYVAFMKEVADYAKETLAVDGILVMSRASVSFTDEQIQTMNQGDVYHFAAGYEPNCIENQGELKTYSQYVEHFNGDLASNDTILAISTGMYSHSHPSGWLIRGTTPALFEAWATKASDYLSRNNRLLPIVTIYNISEWAEGGPGLQPNVKDGFGYLEAISRALGITPGGAD